MTNVPKSQVVALIQVTMKPYQQLIPVAVALTLLGLPATIVGLFSWLPALILKGIFAILTACHVTSVVTEMQELRRLTID